MAGTLGTDKSLQNSVVFRKRGEELFEEGEWEPASSWFAQAIRRDLNDTTSLRKRAACFFQLKKFPMALADMNHLLSLTPGKHELWHQKATYHYHLAQYPEAKAAHERAIAVLDATVKRDDQSHDQRAKYVFATKHVASVYASGTTEQERGDAALRSAGDDTAELSRATWHFHNALRAASQDQNPHEASKVTLQIARIHLKLEDTTKALESANASVRLWPTLMEAHVLLSEIHMEQREFVKLRSDYENILKLDPEDSHHKEKLSFLIMTSPAGNEMLSGDKLFAEGHYSEALERYSAALDLNWGGAISVDRALLQANRGACYCKLGMWPEARTDANYCIANKPKMTDGYLLRAETWMGQHKWNLARDDLNCAEQIQPNSAVLAAAQRLWTERKSCADLQASAAAALTSGQHAHALHCLTQALALNASLHVLDDFHLYLARSEAAFGLSRGSEAMSDANSALKLRPDDNEAKYQAARAHQFTGSWEAATALFTELVEGTPDAPLYQAGLQSLIDQNPATEAKYQGDHFYSSGDFEEALKFYTLAVVQNVKLKFCDQAMLYNARSQTYLMLKRLGEAIEDADAVIDARPDWFEGYVRRAEALTTYQKYTDAHKDYCKALDRCPTNKERVYIRERIQDLKGKSTEVDVHKSAGDVAFTAAEYDEAILAYTEAMDSNHDGWYDDAVLLTCRSRAFLQSGIRADALKDAHNAIKVNPLLPDGYMARMDAYLVLGELLKAQDDCLKALELLQQVPADTSDVHFQKLTITRNKLQDKLAVIRSAIGMETISSGGDAAMAAGAFEDAILQYTLAIEHLQALEGRQQTDFASDLDSSHIVTSHRISIQMAVIYANRSAANAKFGKPRASHAVADAERALEGRPGWMKAYARRAEGLHLLGKLEAAVEDYKRAYEGDELKAYLRRNVLKGFELKGDMFRKEFAYKAAVEQYTLALDGFKSAFQEHADLHADTSMWATPPRMLLHRAEAYRHMSDPAALSDVQAVIKLAPKWAVPRVRLVEVLRTLKRGEEAYAHALQGIAELDIGSTNQAADFERVKAGALLDIQSQDTSAFQARVVKWFSRDAQLDRRTMRIFCVSDLQVDSEANLRWCKALSLTAFLGDVIMVAGNVADTFDGVKTGLRILTSKFRRVFFVPGNRDLWITEPEAHMFPDSVCKLLALLKELDNIGVDTGPAEVARGVFIVPLFSWYNHQFDEKDPVPGKYRFDRFCKFPMKDEVWQWFLAMNEQAVLTSYRRDKASGRGGEECVVLSLSHFVPRADARMPEGVPEIRKNVGCKELDMQIHTINSDVHVFGHTHVAMDGYLGDRYRRIKHVPRYREANTGDDEDLCHIHGSKNTTRYVQNCLDNPEQQGVYCIFDGEQLCGANVPSDGGGDAYVHFTRDSDAAVDTTFSRLSMGDSIVN